MRITHVPLEPYKSRYTEQLSSPNGWEEAALRKRFEQYSVVRPKRDKAQSAIIQSGKVLDSQNRPIWSMDQMKLIAEMPYPELGKYYFSDFFHPGIETLPYLNRQFQAYSFCWAQTFDLYDFTSAHYAWMRPYELMAYQIFSTVFVACPQLKELITSWSYEAGQKTEVVGLPFDSASVARMRDPAYECAKYEIVYSSRMDQEKQPGFFLDLVEKMGIRAAICTGHDELKGDDRNAIDRALKMQEHGRLDIHKGVTKAQYYAVLANSHVQFNCALQDWVSFTLLEALTYGCVPLYPNWRAMPETLLHSEDHLYVPFSIESAVNKLERLLNRPRKCELKDPILTYHDGTLARIAEFMYKN